MAAIWSFCEKTEVASNHIVVGPLVAHHLDCSVGTESVCMCLCEVNAFGESNLKKLLELGTKITPNVLSPILAVMLKDPIVPIGKQILKEKNRVICQS